MSRRVWGAKCPEGYGVPSVHSQDEVPSTDQEVLWLLFAVDAGSTRIMPKT